MSSSWKIIIIILFVQTKQISRDIAGLRDNGTINGIKKKTTHFALFSQKHLP